MAVWTWSSEKAQGKELPLPSPDLAEARRLARRQELVSRTQADEAPAAAPDVKEGKDWGWGGLSCLWNWLPRCWKVKCPQAAVCLVWPG